MEILLRCPGPNKESPEKRHIDPSEIISWGLNCGLLYCVHIWPVHQEDWGLYWGSLNEINHFYLRYTKGKKCRYYEKGCLKPRTRKNLANNLVVLFLHTDFADVWKDCVISYCVHISYITLLSGIKQYCIWAAVVTSKKFADNAVKYCKALKVKQYISTWPQSSISNFCSIFLQFVEYICA